MKKLLFGMMAVAAMAVASCERSFDGAYYAGGGSAMVSVEVGMPDGVTRAFSDGETATQLQYAVYEVDGGTLKLIENDNSTTPVPGDPYQGERTLVNRATKLSFTLLTNHTYGIVFWAAAQNAPYTVEFDEEGATMTYTEGATLTANDDTLDAFWAYKEVDIKGDGSVSVTLKRPFAQINVGTSDYEKAKTLGLDVAVSSISVKNAYTTLNLVDGTATDEQEMAFDTANIPSGETYPVTGYQYLAMAYVLVGTEQEVAEVTFGYGAETANTTRTVGSVPLVRNHRTNIYGALLTSQLDVNVEVDGDTDGDKNVMLTWDGTTKKEPARDEETGAYIVNGADELAWLASQENKTFEDETIILQNDLDLAGKEFPAFAAGTTRKNSGAVGTSFKGVFDGNGKTVSNFTTSMNFADDGSIAGFFTSVEGEDAVVKDVTFVNVEIAGGEQAGVVGIVSDGATVEGVVVKSGKVSSQKAAGGVVGRVLKSGTVKDCENHATVESKTSNAGGIIGAAYYTEEGSSMTISGCNNYGTVTTAAAAGGIVGLCCGDVSDCNNYGTVTGGTTSTGGIVGEQKSAGSVTGCTNYADIKGGSGYGTGGVVGWVRYESSDAYAKLESIEVSGNTNEGKHIKGTTGVGGIVGVWYHDGHCTENINFAETITATGSFVAGIVGDSQWSALGSDKKNGTDTELKLLVDYNKTSTPRSAISGGCADVFIYINNRERTTQENNTLLSTVSSADDFKSAFADIKDGDIIVLSNGDFDCKTVTWPTNGAAVTIKGNGEESKLTNLGYVKADGCDLTLDNLNLFVEKGGSYTSIGFQGAKSVTLKNVKVMGEFHTFSAESAVFEGCYFVHDGVNATDRQGLWCDGYGTTVVKDCIFEVIPPDNNGNETKAILIYSTTNTDMGDVEVTNCTFRKGIKSAKAAVEIHSENFESAGTIKITNCTYDEDTYGGGLWREIYNENSNGHTKGDPTSFYTVYVNGEKESNN